MKVYKNSLASKQTWNREDLAQSGHPTHIILYCDLGDRTPTFGRTTEVQHSEHRDSIARGPEIQVPWNREEEKRKSFAQKVGGGRAKKMAPRMEKGACVLGEKGTSLDRKKSTRLPSLGDPC